MKNKDNNFIYSGRAMVIFRGSMKEDEKCEKKIKNDNI